MQKFVLSVMLAAIISACGTKGSSSSASSTKDYSVHVWGNCEKCKATIEKACKLDGVKSADWGVESKLLTLKLDTGVVSLNTVIESVAKSGYDTETMMADDYAYGSLPECCQYERRSDSK